MEWHSIFGHCLWHQLSDLVSGQTHSTDGVKLFCCLFAMMDKVLCSVFAVCLIFLSHSGHISLLYGRRSRWVFFLVASHHWLCLSTVALSAPLLSAQWYTHKKTIFFLRDIACFSCAIVDCTVFFHHKITAGYSWARPWFLSASVEQGQIVTCTDSYLKVTGGRRATKMFSCH